MATLEQLDGYSVWRERDRSGEFRYEIYRHEYYVASISTLKLRKGWGFEWHDRYMWAFSTEDFINAD